MSPVFLDREDLTVFLTDTDAAANVTTAAAAAAAA